MFVVYDASGGIQWIANISDMDLQFYIDNSTVPVGYGVIEDNVTSDIDQHNFYVDMVQIPPVVVSKQAMSLTLNKSTIIADSVDEFILSTMPDPIDVLWPGGEFDAGVTGGQIEFSTNLPGTHVFTITGIPYITEIVTIEANPSS